MAYAYMPTHYVISVFDVGGSGSGESPKFKGQAGTDSTLAIEGEQAPHDSGVARIWCEGGTTLGASIRQ